MADETQAYWTTAEVAAYFRTAESTVRYWRTLDPPYGPRGALVGRRVLYPIAEVHRFEREEKGVQPSTSVPPKLDDIASTELAALARAYRREHVLSQEAAAERAGVSHPTWRRAERGEGLKGVSRMKIERLVADTQLPASATVTPTREASGQDHTIRVHADESGEMWAEVAELPGCFAAGGTWAELGESIGAAIDLYTRASDRLKGGGTR